MQCLKFFVPVVALSLVLSPTLRAEDAKADKKDVKVAAATATEPRIFVAGHSFHVPIAGALQEIAASVGMKSTAVGRQSIGGSTVTQHWDLPDDKNKAKQALSAGEVDVLTLSPNVLLPDPAIDKFVDLLLEHNPNGRVTVQVSWVPRDGSLGRTLNRDQTTVKQLRAVAEVFTAKVREQVQAVNDRHAGKFKRPVAFVVPVGEAVTLLRERVIDGKVPGITRQSELFRDVLGHGKEPVYLLNAYCHYAVIYGKSPVGLPVPPAFKKAGLGDNTEKVNRILQEIAWQAVTAEPASGVSEKNAQ